MVNKKNKRGVSVIIGYVVLITFGIILSIIVYNYLKTFVPTEISDCPDGVSLFIKEYDCVANGTLSLTIKNNGRFNVNGYFIRGGDTGSEIATIDLSSNFSDVNTGHYVKAHNTIYFDLNATKEFKPNDEQVGNFNLTRTYSFIEIIPVRYQTEENVQKFVTCGNAKIKETLTCS